MISIPLTQILQRRGRAVVLALLGVALLVPVRADAQPNKCTSGKLKCTGTFLSGALGCYANVAKKGLDGDTAAKGESCIRKLRQKFGTAVSSSAGCIEKLVDKQKQDKPETICPAGADEFDLDEIVEVVTLDLIQDRVLPSGAPIGSTCDAGKVKCVAKLVNGYSKCFVKSLKDGVPVDPACTGKVLVKFDGGADPAKGCFAKLEAKQKVTKIKTLCDPDGQSSIVIGGVVTDAVDTIIAAIAP